MAIRPIFIPDIKSNGFVKAIDVEFEWFAGMSLSQKQKSIQSFHANGEKALNIKKILEISSKSEHKLGRSMSAFNLSIRSANRVATVEGLFQGSKVFENGGPFDDLYYKSPLEAKQDQRLKESGDLIKFRFKNMDWPLNPVTVLYDWIYLNVLSKNELYLEALVEFDAFTDIEFNPKKSFNCQARSVALAHSLLISNCFKQTIASPEIFINEMTQGALESTAFSDPVQAEIWDLSH